MADKTVRLVSGEDVLYPKTLVTNILNEDGTQWEPSGGGGSGVETLLLNEADFMTIASLIEDSESDTPIKGRLTGSYEMKPYGLIQGTLEGMTMNLQVSSGITMTPMATSLYIMFCGNNSLVVINLSCSAMDGSGSSYWSYEKQIYTLTSAS